MIGSGDKRAPTLDCADFELIAESIPQIVWMAAPDGSTEYFNRAGTDYTGEPRDASDGWNWMSLLHPEDAERTASTWADAVASGSPYEVEYRLRRHDGEFRRQSCRALPVRGTNGDVVKWIGTVTDIEDHRRLEDSLREAGRRTAESLSLLETLESTAPVGFGFVDRDFRLVRMNQAFASTNGIPIERQLGRMVPEVIPSLWPQLGPIYRGVLETGEAVINFETAGELPGDPGHEHTWLTSFYPVRLDDEMIGIGVIVVDITERKTMEVELKHLSEHDTLTGLFNRRRLFAELDRILRYAARYGHAGAVLMFDIDNFKWVNDSHGHATGDQLLKSVAGVLSARLRNTDVVARLGGDEYAVVLPQATEEQAISVGLDLRARLHERPTGPPVQVSLGIALFGDGEKLSADDVLIAADIAMYGAKQAGGDQTAVYDTSGAQLVAQVKDLREALADERFVLHAQPIIDLRSGQVARRELLIRMLSDAGEIVPPADFLPIAERFSLIGQIDRWVIDNALDIARHEPVTVNLSGRSVGDPGILATVRRALGTGLDPRNLMFEITETAVMGDFERASAFVAALKELGCDLALDDFGTGFGSFTYLKRLPARYLKIDMEFVRGVEDDPTDKQIVLSIVGIAKTLGKETIAEGVESAGVLETLKKLGVDYAQGFYLGAPEPLELLVA